MVKLPKYGAGYYRMKRRLGNRQMEALRREVVEHQQQALKEAQDAHAAQRDRTTYKEYPPPKR